MCVLSVIPLNATNTNKMNSPDLNDVEKRFGELWNGLKMASACAHIVSKVQNCKEVRNIRRMMFEQYAHISGVQTPPEGMVKFINGMEPRAK